MITLLRNSVSKVKPRLKRLKAQASHLSGRHYCPVCDHRVQHFDPLDSYYSDNAKRYGFKYTSDEAETFNVRSYTCPLCGATDRDRLYALYMRDYFKELTSDSTIKILEFAPTPPLSRFIGKVISESKRDFSYRTADLYREDVDDKVDIMDMRNYPDNFFDFFICSHVLEHVTDDKKALGELYRILKPGGQGILVVPIVLTIDDIDEDPSVTDVAERWRRFGQDDHVRLYSKKGFVMRVQQAGFIVHQLGQEFFGESTFTKRGITNQSILYVVEKT